MAELDSRARIAIQTHIRERGAVPTTADLASRLGVERAAVEDALERLYAARVLILRPGTREILAFDPFAAADAPFRVTAAGREWRAICGWDALGVPAALHADGVVHASCADCGDPLDVSVRDGRVDGASGTVLQLGLPALEWWKDIVFT